jgi:UDP-N-acetylmuramoyl-L-alanyl-D-glutamate--2,6-diaminopimelate ligase
MKKSLSTLLSVIEHTSVFADSVTPTGAQLSADPEITSLVFDSREVAPGSLFFALPGTHTTGNIFIPAALKAGAAAIIFQDTFDEPTKAAISAELTARKENVDFIKVSDARFVMAPVADEFYGSPSKHLAVIGVTGTEGKSSTVSFIWQLLRLSGKKAGFISTVQYSLGGDAIDNPQHQTTPEAPVIQHHLAEMVKNGCSYAVIESSSHGLSLRTNRVGCVRYDCGIFMNVTLEHLEFHGTFEQYRNDKANLFRKLDEHDHVKIIGGKEIHVPSFGIVNLEDPAATYFIAATKQPVVGFTTEGKAGKAAAETGADAKPLPPVPAGIPYVIARNIASARYGLSFSMSEPGVVDKQQKPRPGEVIHVKTHLPGAFNAYNIMAALIAVSRLTGETLAATAPLAGQLVPVKGRMTVIDKGQPFELIVDYAHTPSSFETIFPPIRKRCRGKMISLFGSGGERDIKKRPLQGAVAARFCDTVILSDEDPRGEDPVKLLSDIAAGAAAEGKRQDADLFIIPNRPKAIREALRMAKKDDIVLLLGKSHENSIIYKDHVMPYDEIAEAEKALAEMGYTKMIDNGSVL